MFSKATLADIHNSVEKNNALVPSFIPDIDNIVDIPLSITSGFADVFGPEWVTAVYDATSEYEQISGCRISFNVELSNQSQPGGMILYEDNDSSLPECMRDIHAWALSTFPLGNGLVGDKISFDYSLAFEYDSPCKKQQLVMHEIGHALGFTHPRRVTDQYSVHSQCQPNANFIAQHIPSTDNNDDNNSAIMTSGPQCDYLPLSDDDVFANVALYPSTYDPAILKVDIVSQFVLTPTTTSVRLKTSTETGATPFRVDIELRQGEQVIKAYTYYRATEYEKVLKQLLPGNYTVQATFSNYKGDYSISSDVVSITF